MIRAIGSLIGPALVVLLFWAIGFDFDKRGGMLFSCINIALISYLGLFVLVPWEKLK